MLLQEQLSALGDPSGRHDADYWNQWFQIVCQPTNNEDGTNCSEMDDKTRPTTTKTTGKPKESFEWYCGPDQIIPILKYHLQNKQQEKEDDVIRMVHPGSGTSLLPIELLRPENFPNSHHTILDVSQIAIEKFQQIIKRHSNSNNNGIDLSKNIECHVVDLLQSQQQQQLEQQRQQKLEEHAATSSTSPPPHVKTGFSQLFPDNSFDCWIDKGFVDAVFSSNDDTTEKASPRHMFENCHRLLKRAETKSKTKTEPSASFAMTISLAEDHSLRILLDPWLLNCRRQGSSRSSAADATVADADDCSFSCSWSEILHIWEVVPVSGPLLSFCFVLHTTAVDTAITVVEEQEHLENKRKKMTVIWHTLEGTEETINIPDQENDDDDNSSDNNDNSSAIRFEQDAFQEVQRRIQKAREAFRFRASSEQTNKQQQLHQQPEQKQERKLLVLLDIKPYSAKSDLLELSRRIRTGGHGQQQEQQQQNRWRNGNSNSSASSSSSSANDDTLDCDVQQLQEQRLSHQLLYPAPPQWLPFATTSSSSSSSSTDAADFAFAGLTGTATSASNGSSSSNSGSGNCMEQIIPIGYGISKLRLQCLVESEEHLEAIVTALPLLAAAAPPLPQQGEMNDKEEKEETDDNNRNKNDDYDDESDNDESENDDDDDDDDSTGGIIQSVDIESVTPVMMMAKLGKIVSPLLAVADAR